MKVGEGETALSLRTVFPVCIFCRVSERVLNPRVMRNERESLPLTLLSQSPSFAHSHSLTVERNVIAVSRTKVRARGHLAAVSTYQR